MSTLNLGCSLDESPVGHGSRVSFSQDDGEVAAQGERKISFTPSHRSAASTPTGINEREFPSNESELSRTTANRHAVQRIVKSAPVQSLSAVCIMMTLVLTCIEVDMRATDLHLPLWINLWMGVCFAVYILEFLGIAYVERQQLVRKPTNCMEFFVILVGIGDYFLDLVGWPLEGPFQILRFVRFLRLVHFAQQPWFKKHARELRKLVMMISSSFKTLFWSFLFCFLVMTFWATISVELLHHRMEEMALRDPELWRDCDRCRRAFASVMTANLTFFQTIVAGDDWGRIAVPMIEAHPWSAVIFVGALMTLVYGVLGLIVAVVVDMFADLRARDIANIADDLEQEEDDQKAELHRLFELIDKDRSGTVSMSEILKAVKHVPKFSHYLRILRVDKDALSILFQCLDTDGNGQVDRREFVEAMYAMMSRDDAVTTPSSRLRGSRRSLGSGKNIGFEEKVDGMCRKLSLMEKNMTTSVKLVEAMTQSNPQSDIASLAEDMTLRRTTYSDASFTTSEEVVKKMLLPSRSDISQSTNANTVANTSANSEPCRTPMSGRSAVLAPMKADEPTSSRSAPRPLMPQPSCRSTLLQLVPPTAALPDLQVPQPALNEAASQLQVPEQQPQDLEQPRPQQQQMQQLLQQLQRQRQGQQRPYRMPSPGAGHDVAYQGPVVSNGEYLAHREIGLRSL